MRLLTSLRAFFIAALAVGCGHTAFAQTATSLGNFDLVILLDESGSIQFSPAGLFGGETEWTRELDLARDLVLSFSYGPDRTAAAIGAYGTTARSFVDMSMDEPQILNTLSPANLPVGGNSCHTCAFEFASAQFANYGRTDAPNVTIFITDGVNNVRSEEFSAALAQLQATSVVFAIGIEDGAPSIVDPIASDIAGIQTSFFANSFVQTSSLVNGILQNLALYESSLGGPVAPIPEPETYAMLLAGLGLLGFEARRRKISSTK